MFYSSSLMLVEVFNIDLEKQLRDILDFENESFLSLNFYDNKKDAGEIHWSKSFQNGKMNFLNFIRYENLFLLFTSNISNLHYLTECLRLMTDEVIYKVLKFPLDIAEDSNIFKNLKDIRQKIVVPFVSVQLSFMYNEKLIFMKIYSNGLITYSMTNDTQLVRRVIDIAKIIMKVSDQDND